VALRHGVTFDLGRSFRFRPQDGGLAIRVCYSTVPEHEIEAGVIRLANAWTELSARS